VDQDHRRRREAAHSDHPSPDVAVLERITQFLAERLSHDSWISRKVVGKSLVMPQPG
jgi:hypothetical protein